MLKTTAATLFVVSALAASDASARLLSATLPPPDESSITAVHLPTGCLARVTFSYDALVKAQITDPACLPKGVTARDIPATEADFANTSHEASEAQPYPNHLLRRR